MDLDRPVAGRLRLEHALHAGLLLLALSLRLLWLAERPLHHDESIHAYYAWRILEHGASDYRYDPVYHGPSLYYGTAILHAVLGASDFSARALPVLCSLGLVALAWPLRAFVGREAALAYAVLVTISPTLGYYGRSLRHDVPMAFFTLAGVLAFFHHVKTRRRPPLYLCGLLIGIATATKEDIYLTAFLFANALWIVPLWSGTDAGLEGGVVPRLRRWIGLCRERLSRDGIPLLSGVFITLTTAVILYTSLLTHPENWSFISRAIRYWWGQHEMQRIGGPWWYYLPLEIVYEPLIFVPALLALGAAFARRWRGEPSTLVEGFFGTWAILSFAIYAWAQEKVPWLLIPSLVPQAVLAGMWFGERPRRALAWAPVGALTVWSLVTSSFLYDAPRPEEPPDAAHSEPMVYVQTTYDVPEVVATIEDASRKLRTGRKTPMVVTGDATWPLSWYLREYPVHWGSLPAETSAPVVIVDPKDADRLERDLGDGWSRRRFAVRGWWQIDWSKITPANVVRFLLYRLAWNPPGTTDAVLFLAKDLSPRAVREPAKLSPAPAALAYTKRGEAVEPERVIGRPGNGAGELREPRGLAFDDDGNLLVADTGNHRIQRFEAGSGRSLDVWGGPDPGDEPGRFRSPSDVAVGPDGSIYVADTWNHRIQKLAPDGTVVLEWREQDPGFWGPRAIEVSSTGLVFVADTGNKRVLAYDPDGRQRLVFGGEGADPGQFVEPVGLALDEEAGRLFVADTGNRRVQTFDLQGQFLAEWRARGWEEFYTEPYLALAGSVLVATDSFANRINVYGPGGRLRRSLGGAGSGLDHPVGVVISDDGALYASDTRNHRVVVLRAGVLR